MGRLVALNRLFWTTVPRLAGVGLAMSTPPWPVLVCRRVLCRQGVWAPVSVDEAGAVVRDRVVVAGVATAGQYLQPDADAAAAGAVVVQLASAHRVVAGVDPVDAARPEDLHALAAVGVGLDV